MPTAARLDLTFLGSGNAFAPGRCWSGFLLNGRYLFDAPPTALLSLKRLSFDLAAIDTILISHFHSDHFFGLPFLLLEYTYQTRRRNDLTLVGPPGIEDRLQRLMELGNPGTLGRDAGFRLRFEEVSDGSELEVNGLRVQAVEVVHGGEKLRCFGYRGSLAGRKLAYTGDTTWCDGLLRLGRDTEVLVTDCTYAEGRNLPEHLSFDEVRDLRGLIDPDTTIILTHLGGQTPSANLDRVQVASDLATFSFR